MTLLCLLLFAALRKIFGPGIVKSTNVQSYSFQQSRNKLLCKLKFSKALSANKTICLLGFAVRRWHTSSMQFCGAFEIIVLFLIYFFSVCLSCHLSIANLFQFPRMFVYFLLPLVTANKDYYY